MPPLVFLAPMAGFTDAAMREICSTHGAGLCVTEMISAKAMSYKNIKTQNLLKLGKFENIVVVQLFGHEPDVMADSAAAIEQLLGAALYAIDINMACPMPKIVGNGDGCALMKTPLLAAKIIRTTKSRVKCGVSIKIRKGFDDENVNAVDFARMAESEGCGSIAVHGRTRTQYYSGTADWNIIKKVKAAVNINVVGNGDVTSGQSAVDLLGFTGCDTVMVGRAAVGNPFIFGEINAALKGLKYEHPTNMERVRVCLEHAKKICEYKSERTAMLQMRRIAPRYVSGFYNSAKYRKILSQILSLAQLENVLGDILSDSIVYGKTVHHSWPE